MSPLPLHVALDAIRRSTDRVRRAVMATKALRKHVAKSMLKMARAAKKHDKKYNATIKNLDEKRMLQLLHTAQVIQ